MEIDYNAKQKITELNFIILKIQIIVLISIDKIINCYFLTYQQFVTMRSPHRFHFSARLSRDYTIGGATTTLSTTVGDTLEAQQDRSSCFGAPASCHPAKGIDDDAWIQRGPKPPGPGDQIVVVERCVDETSEEPSVVLRHMTWRNNRLTRWKKQKKNGRNECRFVHHVALLLETELLLGGFRLVKRGSSRKTV